ncbi:MAG: hypothetical protein J7539_03385 [Niabella sp.]|nr:hypothetical protein [Niabella sp.]
MATATGTIESLLLELGKAIGTLDQSLQTLGDDIYEKLGTPLPAALRGNSGILAKTNAVVSKVAALAPIVSDLAGAIASTNIATIIQKGSELTAAIPGIITSIKELATAITNLANALPSAADRDALLNMLPQLAERLLEYAIVGALGDKAPYFTRVANLLGLIDKEPTPLAGVTLPPATTVIPRRIYLDQLPVLLSDPGQYLKNTFQWGNPGFDGKKLYQKVLELMQELGLPGDLTAAVPPKLEAGGTPGHPNFTLSLTPSLNLGYLLQFAAAKSAQPSFNISPNWKATTDLEIAAAASIAGEWSFPFAFTVNPTGSFSLKTSAGVKGEKSSGDPINIISITGSTGLQAKSISGSLGLTVDSAGMQINPSVQIKVEEGKLIIDFSQGDGFIQQLLSGVHFEADFGFTATWDPKNGLKLQGSGGVELFIPLQVDLVLIQVKGIYFSLGFSTETPVKLGLGAQLGACLGPLKALVDDIGTNINLSFPTNGSGNLSFAQMGFGFQPPNGVGLSLDTGPIKGGGFLKLDPAKGEYFGYLELSFQGIVDLKAIGIINTKMPDGSNGFSLLILITAEFTPIQLGFGFTLNGVGGLLGLNRSTDVDALKLGVRSGAVSNILFPENIESNFNQIISDLKSIFPIAEGHFILAPMAKLGWGTPTLITLELGIIIDIPSPQLVILGVLRCILPSEDVPLLSLQVNFAGGIDFTSGLWFDASLFDSKLLTFVLTGDMALRINWGDHPSFIISVGGFHPKFKEIPPDLVGMKRLSISLLSGDNPRITISAYFAITSNTVQSGARAELYAAACGFNIYGFLGYDLLVQFSPFHFIADIDAGIALRCGTDEIAGIDVHCELSGPTPWNANGDASLKILFFKISVHFNVTWGDNTPAQPIEKVMVLDLVAAALSDQRNWKADLLPNTSTNVTLKTIALPADQPDAIVVQPFTILSVSQKVAPLDYKIDKFGNKGVDGDNTFTITTTAANTDTKEEFAVSNFTKLNDDEKLSRESFTQLKSGIRFQTSDASQYGNEIDREVTYELKYYQRSTGLIFVFGQFQFLKDAFDIFVKGNAINKSALAVNKKIATNAPATINVAPPAYSVVHTSNMELVNATSVAASEAEAYNLQQALISGDPTLKNKIQVVSQFELN